MPIEREFKFILKGTDNLENELRSKIKEDQITVLNINQGYLSKGGRVRSKEIIYKEGVLLEKSIIEYFFTFKHTMLYKKGILELEYQMSFEDYQLAWSECDNKIQKTRYVIGKGIGFTWEIDFFKNKNTYLALAECEIEELGSCPEILHPFVEKHLLYKVEEQDKRFQNRKLSNENNVKKLLREISK